MGDHFYVIETGSYELLTLRLLNAFLGILRASTCMEVSSQVYVRSQVNVYLLHASTDILFLGNRMLGIRMVVFLGIRMHFVRLHVTGHTSFQ